MQLEAISDKPENYIDLTLEKKISLLITNWESLVPAMLDSTLTVSARAALFHASLAQALLEQARTLRDDFGVNTVSLSGGVFQNRVLTEYALALLSEHGFDAHLPELIPVNDAGISFGQIMEYGYKR